MYGHFFQIEIVLVALAYYDDLVIRILGPTGNKLDTRWALTYIAQSSLIYAFIEANTLPRCTGTQPFGNS